MLWSDVQADPDADVQADPETTVHAEQVAPVQADPVALTQADPVQARQADVAADEAFLAEVAAELDAIQAALVRLDDSTFDLCQICGARIGEERLLADPLTTRCLAHD